MQIITVQHTQAVHHTNGMVGGSTDWPLTPLGHRQARRIARRLRKELGRSPDYVLYASDMTRTAQTAQIISKALQLPIEYVPALREIKMGSATGQSRAWLKAHSTPRASGALFLDHRPLPDAETWREMSQRVSQFLERLEADGRDAIVVGHGGSLGAFVQRFLQIPEDSSEYVWACGRAGSVHRLEKRTEGERNIYMLKAFNEMHW